MIIGQLIPDWLESFGSEVSRLWPIVVLITAIVGAIWRGNSLLKKTINDTIDPVLVLANETNTTKFEHLELRLVNIESQLFPNGGSSLRDKIDRISLQLASFNAVYYETKTLTSLLFEIDPHAMYRTDARGLIEDCNQAFLDLWGLNNVDEAKMVDWLRYTANPQSVQYSFSIILESKTKFSYVLEISDGRVLKVFGYPLLAEKTFIGFIGYAYPLPQTELEE